MIQSVKRALSAIVETFNCPQPFGLEYWRETADKISIRCVLLAEEVYDLRQQLATARANAEWSIGEANDLARVAESLRRELAAEREAHVETKRFWGPDTVAQLKAELASALDKLDKLTRWRKLSEEPCPDSLSEVEWSEEGRASMGRCSEDDLGQFDYWRFTPESLQALEESESGNG